MAPAAKAWAMIFFTLEVAAVAFNYMSFADSLYNQKWRSDGSSPTESVRKHSFRIIPRVGYIDTTVNCIHIFLLIAVGFGMIEAVGHSDLHSWRASCFYSVGVIYTHLTLLAVASSSSANLRLQASIIYSIVYTVMSNHNSSVVCFSVTSWKPCWRVIVLGFTS